LVIVLTSSIHLSGVVRLVVGVDDKDREQLRLLALRLIGWRALSA